MLYKILIFLIIVTPCFGARKKKSRSSKPSYSEGRTGPLLGVNILHSKLKQFPLKGNQLGAKIGIAINPWFVVEGHWIYSKSNGSIVFSESGNPGYSPVVYQNSVILGSLRIHPFGKWLYVEGGGGYGTFSTSVDNFLYQQKLRHLQSYGSGPIYYAAGGIEWVFHFFSISIRGMVHRQIDQYVTYWYGDKTERISPDDYPMKGPFELRNIGIDFAIYL